MKKKPTAGGVSEYIAACPKEVQSKLRDMRTTIRATAPGAVETTSYFDMPGYCYEGYAYNGMFVWFSFKAPFIRLHVRPAALTRYKKELAKYEQTRAIVSFPAANAIPKTLVKKLVKASLADMKLTAKI